VRPLRALDPWLPPLLLMAVIFAFSAQPHLSSGLGLIDQIGRKLVHFCEYGLLCGLWWRALRTRMASRSALVAAVAIASAYAVTDEIHQHFVAGRHGSPLDWLIDTTGAVFAALLIRRRTPRRAPA
jgi:VanZ family protein